MNLAAQIKADIANRPTGDGQDEGLKLVEERIESVIKVVDQELEALRPARFEAEGHIAPGSFGAADNSPLIALHHSRAHTVTARTLRGVKEELELFRDACRDARRDVRAADEGVADRMALQRRAVDRLEAGASTGEGDRAYDEARNEQPTELPSEDPA